MGMGAVCTGGLLLLLLYWLPEWGVKGTCTHTSVRNAHTLLLRSTVRKPSFVFFRIDDSRLRLLSYEEKEPPDACRQLKSPNACYVGVFPSLHSQASAHESS